MDQRQQPWNLTVMRLENIGLMHSSRSWRPIVTVEIDNHSTHETILGVDGQNINQKETFSFDQAKFSSILKVDVWQRSQSKKKSRKRNLIASGCHSLGELLKIQEHKQKLEIPLQVQYDRANINNKNKSVWSGGSSRTRNEAALRVILLPPSHIQNVDGIMAQSGQCEDTTGPFGIESPFVYSSDPATPDSDQPPITDSIRRRPVRGYKIYSSDDCRSESSDEEDHHKQLKPIFDDNDSLTTCNNGSSTSSMDPDSDDSATMISEQPHSVKPWIVLFLLPISTLTVEVPSSLSRLENIIASFTMYKELREANTDSHYELVFDRLQEEWKFVGKLLIALTAVNTASFAGVPQSLFPFSTNARHAIAASSIASGLGIACDAWFLLRYSWVDLPTFIVRARDVYDSYFFFSISARVPGLCMLFSIVCLMLFLVIVAFEVWFEGALVISYFVGILMSLPGLARVGRWLQTRVGEAVRARVEALWRLWRVARSMAG